MKWGDRTLKLCFGNNKATQFNFWEYISRTSIYIGLSSALHLQCKLKADIDQICVQVPEPMGATTLTEEDQDMTDESSVVKKASQG
jgi:hypothetical protein